MSCPVALPNSSMFLSEVDWILRGTELGKRYTNVIKCVQGFGQDSKPNMQSKTRFQCLMVLVQEWHVQYSKFHHQR